MISLDKAKALKEAGLKWEPQEWDLYLDAPVMIDGRARYLGGHCIDYTPSNLRPMPEVVINARIWLPSLSQLLAEIKKHSGCALYVFDSGLRVLKKGAYEIELPKVGIDTCCFRAHAPEDAAADALLWILGQVGEGNDATDKG
jgi:hypothetical protein